MKAYAPLTREFFCDREAAAALSFDLCAGPCRHKRSLPADLVPYRCGGLLRQSGFWMRHPSPATLFLRYLYENAVQPEIWRDVIADF